MKIYYRVSCSLSTLLTNCYTRYNLGKFYQIIPAFYEDNAGMHWSMRSNAFISMAQPPIRVCLFKNVNIDSTGQLSHR